MKHIITLIVLFFLISCSNDDEGIDGTFVLVAFEIETSLDFDNNGVSSTNLVGEIGCFRNIELSIRSDGTGTSFSQGDPVYRESIDEFSESGVSTFVTCNVTNGITVEFTWSQNGNTIETVGQGITIAGTITETELEYVVEDGFTFTIVNDGEEIEVTEDVTYRYILETM